LILLPNEASEAKGNFRFRAQCR